MASSIAKTNSSDENLSGIVRSGSTGSTNAPPSKLNPNNVLGPNEYAGFVAPSRGDQSTIAGGGRDPYYGSTGEKGNTFDRATFETVRGTGVDVSDTPTVTKPAGPISARDNLGSEMDIEGVSPSGYR